MRNFIVKNYTEYDISGIGVPKAVYVEELESALKAFANKESYNKFFKEENVRRNI